MLEETRLHYSLVTVFVEVGRERPHFSADDPPKSFVGSLSPSQLMRVDVLRVCKNNPRSLSDSMSDIL